MFAQLEARAGAAAPGTPAALPAPEILFNPDLKTSVIMVPGLCGIILVFVGTVATALGVVRERQAGTLEQLAVMPFRPADVFVGKIGPYLLIAAIDMVVIVLVGILLFGVPFAGSIATFALGAALFLFVTLGIGVLVSTVSQTQGQAIQLAMMTMLPADPAQRPVLPALLDALGRALDRLLPAADVVRQGRARCDGARHADRRRSGCRSLCLPPWRRSSSRSRCCAFAATWRPAVAAERWQRR